ncbi:MAG: DUF2029 domain-containing protein, partial [Bacteroidetes bacterium]|nr:DUF2029 domain-containing protein [Bacteroidota bacterium]
MRFFNNRSFFLLLTFCSLLLYFFCAYNLERAEFTTYLPTYLLLFVLYIFMVRSELDLKYGIIAGVCFRLILLMSIPNLSDDYFRFIWDGYLNGIGINPFQYTPTEFMAMQTETSPIVQELYNEMNSPDYYSIYPPISQFFFSLSGFFFLNIQKGVVLMRLVLIVAELLTLLLMIRSLQELKKPTWLSMLYFLNPLVILELTGNLHLEGLSIVALLAFLFYFFRKKTGMSSVAMGVAVSIKLNPLMFIPLLFRSVDLKRMMIYVVI